MATDNPKPMTAADLQAIAVSATTNQHGITQTAAMALVAEVRRLKEQVGPPTQEREEPTAFQSASAAQDACVSAVGDKYTNTELERLVAENPTGGPGFVKMVAAIRARNEELEAAEQRIRELEEESAFFSEERIKVVERLTELETRAFDRDQNWLASQAHDEEKRLRAKCSRQRRELRAKNQQVRALVGDSRKTAYIKDWALHALDEKPPSIESIHRAFHYVVTRWLQEQGADCVGGSGKVKPAGTGDAFAPDCNTCNGVGQIVTTASRYGAPVTCAACNGSGKAKR